MYSEPGKVIPTITTTSTVADLTFIPPDGIADKYIIHLYSKKDPTKIVRTFTISVPRLRTPRFHQRIFGLNPNSDYIISIIAVSNGVEGDPTVAAFKTSKKDNNN